MESIHRLIIGDASDMDEVQRQTIDLVVTSPPYPMIEMWDDAFCAADPGIEHLLKRCAAEQAFERMHALLDKVWQELRRAVKPGGIACITIGDATRTFDGHFQLFANHARIIAGMKRVGFTQLPAILWRKPTNAPTKFMGSGMLPAGAYVTLEHEYVLIFRQNGKRIFDDEALKKQRRRSAFFWEERNEWFSDIWLDLRGTPQALNQDNMRQRSGAFPLNLPYRLINMFSLKGDMVLDPFLGTGTTMLAAMCCGRNSIGYEVDAALQAVVLRHLVAVPEIANRIIAQRLSDHVAFVQERLKKKMDIKYRNRFYGFPVVTRQEVDLQFERVSHMQFISEDRFKVVHAPSEHPETPVPVEAPQSVTEWTRLPYRARQLKLF